MNNHKDLDVWNKSMDMVESVYKILEKFPNSEKYILVDQIKRSAISVPSNIAEGAGRQSNKEFIKFLYISMGSLSELETQLLLAKRLQYLEKYEELEIDNIRKMIIGLINYLKNNF